MKEKKKERRNEFHVMKCRSKIKSIVDFVNKVFKKLCTSYISSTAQCLEQKVLLSENLTRIAGLIVEEKQI